MQRWYDSFYSPIGVIHVVVNQNGLEKVSIFENEWVKYKKENTNIRRGKKVCNNVIVQLKEYFNGERKNFEIPISLKGTKFQIDVWKTLLKIPYGETRSYLQVAQLIGNAKAVRAVGQANKANKIPIIIPCHRVIGNNGKLTGYAGDKINIKYKLLLLEKSNKF